MITPDVRRQVEQAYREHWPRLLGLLAGQLRRLELAEDCLQEAFAVAVTSWQTDGVPDNPAGWLRTTAYRKALDRLRSEATATRKLPLLVVAQATLAEPEEHSMRRSVEDSSLPDERLQLLFTCCHPALAPESRSALMLRFVGGLTTAEIARLFLVPPATMAARLTRAKKKIAIAGIPFRVPGPDQMAARLDVVLAVIYLIFTQGYRDTPGHGEAAALAPSAEAIRLGRVLNEAMPGRPPVQALLALMVAQHSRRDARFTAAGDLVLLPEQRRDHWHWDEIRYAANLLGQARLEARTELLEPYRLQAMIALEHAVSTAEQTNWHRIATLYGRLEQLTGSPVVRLNRAVAVLETGDFPQAWELLAELDSSLEGNHQLWTVRGELLIRMNNPAAAVAAFERALLTVPTDPERRHLARRREIALAATNFD